MLLAKPMFCIQPLYKTWKLFLNQFSAALCVEDNTHPLREAGLTTLYTHTYIRTYVSTPRERNCRKWHKVVSVFLGLICSSKVQCCLCWLLLSTVVNRMCASHVLLPK